MNEGQAERPVSRLPGYSGADRLLPFPDGTGVSTRYEIANRFSEHLQTHCSAVYRTADEHAVLFARCGFNLSEDEEGCPLDGHLETRLRICRHVWRAGRRA